MLTSGESNTFEEGTIALVRFTSWSLLPLLLREDKRNEALAKKKVSRATGS
jgi:hypothetical protein